MATYPTHGVHLRQRHPTGWLLLTIVVVAALVGAGAWALVDHYAGGTTETTTGPAMLMSSGIANKYIAALDKLDPYALQPILANNAVEIDKGFASRWPGATTLEGNWAQVFGQAKHESWRGSLCCAAPHWAAVTWRWSGSTNPLTHKPFKMNGLSILDMKNGKIIRETFYWDVPGRNPGIAANVGRKYATTLRTQNWGTLRSLFSKNAIGVDMTQAPQVRNANHATWDWQTGLKQLQGSLCCAAPAQRTDNGKMASSWAVVDWVAQSSSSGSKVSGVSILQLDKQGKIIRETLYY